MAFYTAIGVSQKGFASSIGRAKKLKREGVYPEESFKEIKVTAEPSEILQSSKCEHLVTDVFSGYRKAIKDTNIYRRENNLPVIRNVYCNAHARRKFKESLENYKDESLFFIEAYKKVYALERIAQKRPPDRVLRVHKIMRSLFKSMRDFSVANIGGYSSKSSIGRAMSYYLKNYVELSLFLDHQDLPIDNNSQERLMRSPVIGRKTWYGNHSKRGAQTTAILFSLVESCKLNQVNPREYFSKLVQDLHKGQKAYTPSEFKMLCEN